MGIESFLLFCTGISAVVLTNDEPRGSVYDCTVFLMAELAQKGVGRT